METQRIGCFSVQVEPRSPVQQSSKRNWHAKVRTGCSTCKKRRVKCDETRPHCMRCVKLGSPCGGYVQGPESSSDKNGITTRNRILLPNTYSTCLRPNPGTTCFRSEQEKAYFGSWFTKSQGFCEDSLFSIFFVAVSQLALDQNEVLRDIVLALGALTLAPGQQVHTLTPNQQQNIRSGPHYQTALSCYGRALRAMSAMAVSEATVGTILRCCILLICFDLVDGRHQSVHVHIQHGLRILRQYLLSKAGRVDFDLCANAPAPCIVDESMIHLFQRCSSISYVQLGARYSLQHCEMAPSRREGAERSKLLESMLPRKFYTIDEAARWLDLLQNALRSLFLESEASNHGLDDESNRIWEAERSRHVRVLECWAAAFLALERKQVNIGEDEDIAQGEGDRVGLQMMRRIAALKMQYHNAYIFSYTSHYHDYESLVEMEPRFRDIVDLAGTLIGDQSVPEVHTVVPLTISGAILPLFVTANKCRDAGVRRSAEELLRQLSNRVEGLWDSRAALALTSWARKAEEAYALQLSDPKEIWNKVRSRYILFSDRQNQATVGFQWWREGSWVYLEEVVEW